MLHLPPLSTVRVQYTFSKLLQRWNEYTPDPHHGFYVPPSTVTVREWKEGAQKSGGPAPRRPAAEVESSREEYDVGLERALPQNMASYTHWLVESGRELIFPTRYLTHVQ